MIEGPDKPLSPAARRRRARLAVETRDPGELPQLPKRRLLGNLVELQRDRLGFLRRVLSELGEVGMFHLGPRPIYVFTAPWCATEVLVEQWPLFEKGPVLRTFARPFLGDSVVSCLNADHPQKRGLLTPPFRPPEVARHVELIVRTVNSATARWTDGQALDLYEELRRLTMRVTGLLLFAVDPVEEARALGKALDVAMGYISARLQNPLHLPLAVPTPANLRVRRAAKRVDRFIRALVEERRANPQQGRGDVLSALLAAPPDQRLSDRALVDNLKSLFLAGFETTANAAAFAWSFVSRNPDVQSRLHAELDAVLGGRDPVAADLENLPYTLQVVRETLRIYPPVHTIGRQTKASVKIGEHRLPEGAIVLVCPYLMHRREEVFPEPERFDPDRFTADRFAALPKLAYLPFGAGPRSCLGDHLALAQLQLLLAVIGGRFTFDPVGPAPEPEPLMTIRPRGGVHVVVRRRT